MNKTTGLEILEAGADRRVRGGMLLAQVTVCALLAASLFAPAPLSTILAGTALALTVAIIVLTSVISRIAHKAVVGLSSSFEDAKASRQQIEELFAMTDMLQSAEEHEDAGAVLMATSLRLLPEFGGALYVFNNSRDRLDLAKSWNTSDAFDPPDSLLPQSCWALKRGKPHINDIREGTLCCSHHIGSAGMVEVPMMARGQVCGLLVLAIDGEHSFKRLMKMRRLARALADSMSLALSNIALRETLRTQSLRDPLTGLYNRRYMEDALSRYISLNERTGGATSVLMIDLDNFKALNDQHGHGKGDAVLRDVAAQLVGSLRPSDVVSRYGGEELLVILPGCDSQDAFLKAEVIRHRIESLSEAHGAAISASIGIASVPETSAGASDVVPMADAALYAAKQDGKNCVRVADKRSGKEEFQPRLAVG
ncbi:MAG: diguanylate cyclase [Novosphingobium sp.]